MARVYLRLQFRQSKGGNAEGAFERGAVNTGKVRIEFTFRQRKTTLSPASLKMFHFMRAKSSVLQYVYTVQIQLKSLSKSLQELVARSNDMLRANFGKSFCIQVKIAHSKQLA